MATAAAAGISRVTLHRIENGAASVTLGALMNVLDALDLCLGPLEGAGAGAPAEPIERAVYPLLQQLAWHVHGTGTLSPAEAAGLYARQRRRLDLEELQPHERHSAGPAESGAAAAAPLPVWR